MKDLKTVLETELKLVEQLIDMLDTRSGRGVLIIPENLQSEDDFTDALTAALSSPLMVVAEGDTSFLPFIIKGPESVCEGLDQTGDQAFLYTLFDRSNRLQQRISRLEELDKETKPLV